MAQRQPDPREDEPQDVADAGAQARARLVDDGPAERPEGVEADPEGRDAERDAEDGDAPQHPEGEVGEEHPEATQDEPQQVEQEPHRVTPDGYDVVRGRGAWSQCPPWQTPPATDPGRR